MSNKLLGYIKENKLTHDDVIAMIDKHLQREITEEGLPDGEEEVIEGESENSTSNDEVAENDEIEQISNSLNKKLEDLDHYILEKKKEIDEKIKKIKRKSPPGGETSDKALTNKEKIKANWFEVDI